VGSKKSSKSSSVSGSAQAWAKPYATAAASNIANTYQQYAPSTSDAVTGIGNLSDTMTGEYTAGQPGAQAGRDYYNDAISGKYLNNNPYVNQMVGQMREGVTDSVTSRMALGGRYGSGVHQGVMAKELANAENQLRFNVYNQERGLQQQAAAGAQSGNAALGQLALGGYASQAAAPYAGMAAYGSSMGNLFSGGTQSQTTYAPNPIWGAVGAGIGALGAAFSDRRLKRNIVKVGEFDNGLGKYQWIYRNDPTNTVCEGVMADEVKALVPEAYGESSTGYGMVDYAKLGIPMKVLA
jgi:hypothetical protein